MTTNRPVPVTDALRESARALVDACRSLEWSAFTEVGWGRVEAVERALTIQGDALQDGLVERLCALHKRMLLTVEGRSHLFEPTLADCDLLLDAAALSPQPLSVDVEAVSFAWTACDGYKRYPPYVNLTGNKLVVRGVEHFQDDYYHPGDRVEVELPPEATAELRAAILKVPQ